MLIWTTSKVIPWVFGLRYDIITLLSSKNLAYSKYEYENEPVPNWTV